MIDTLRSIYRAHAPKPVKTIFRFGVAFYQHWIVESLLSRICGAIAVLKSSKAAILVGRPAFIGDGFATTHHLEFLNDRHFMESFNGSIAGLPGTWSQLVWRAHICAWAASRAPEGDFVECGVWYGVLSNTICRYTDFARQPRTFFLVDTWGPLPGHHENYGEDIYNFVEGRFSAFPNVKLVRGLVPDVLPSIKSEKIAYLSIDMNGSEPERAALEYFYDKIVPGGVIYFDDYGWQYPALRAVVNEFFRNKPERLLHFPSGNTIAIKV